MDGERREIMGSKNGNSGRMARGRSAHTPETGLTNKVDDELSSTLADSHACASIASWHGSAVLPVPPRVCLSVYAPYV